jgi:hypothetical protein
MLRQALASFPRHSGESRNPERQRLTLVALDPGLRRGDARLEMTEVYSNFAEGVFTPMLCR